MDEIVFFVIQIVIIFLANRASKKLLSNLHMCRESATCNRFREHLFPRSGGGKSRNTRARLILALGVLDEDGPFDFDSGALASFSSHRAPPCSGLIPLRSSP